jgi:response regulator RpfG family c-di-GMP phosphodiesterase
MSEVLNILVVDDEPLIREFIITALTAEIPAQYYEAENGTQAIELMMTGNFDLILCDFNMPKGNGQDVFKKRQTLNNPPKFILVTSDDEANHRDITNNAGCGYLEKPFEFETLIEKVSTMLCIEALDINKDKFTLIPMGSIINLEILPFDIYVKLGTNHQIKYFNASRKLSAEDKGKLSTLKTKGIFIRVDDFFKYIADRQRNVFQSSVLPQDGIEHSFEMSSVNDELIQMGLKKILEDKEVVDLTQKNLKTVFALSFKIKALNGLLNWVQNNDLSPKKMQSVLLTLFCNLILKNLKSNSYDFKTYLSLGYVAVLHDLNLDDFMVKNEYRILNGIKLKSQINKAEQAILLEHVSTIMPVIKSWPYCPPEVIQMIEQHHERPNGLGFPANLSGNEITKLSAIFNVAHDVTSLVLEKKTGEDLRQNLGKLAEEYRGFKHFEEPFGIIINEVMLK